MKKIVVILFCCLSWFEGFSQMDSLVIDTLTDEYIQWEFFEKPRIELKITHQRTLITEGVNVKFNGINLGYQFKGKYKAGLALFYSETYETTNTDYPDVNYFITQVVGYGAYFEYIAFHNYRYQIGFPISAGTIWEEYTAHVDYKTKIPEYDYRSDSYGLYSLGVNASYSVNYWLLFSVGGGYRHAIGGDPEINNILSNAYYSFGVKFQLGKFIKSVRTPEEVLHMRSLYFKGRKGKEMKYRVLREKSRMGYLKKQRVKQIKQSQD